MDIESLLSPSRKGTKLISSYFSPMSKEEALSITPQSAGSTSSASVSSMMDKIQRKVLHELTVVNDIKHKQILKEKRAKVKHSGNILQPHFKKTRHSWTPERRLHILKRIADLRMQVYAAKGVRVGVAKVPVSYTHLTLPTICSV